MAVPSFLLRKLYVKGSLKATQNGFEFALKNTLAPGSIIGLSAVTVDDTVYPSEAITISGPHGQWSGNQITSKSPVTFPVNVETKISVQGQAPGPGSHHVVLAVITREVGRIEIDLTDTIS